MSLSSLAETERRSDPAWSRVALWVAATVLAALGTALLYSAAPGLNWALSALAFALSFLGFCSHSGKAARPGVVLPLALACFVAFDSVLTADTTFQVYIAIFSLYALATAVLAAAGNPRPTDRTSVLASPVAVAIVAGEAFTRISAAGMAVHDTRNASRFRGAALAVPIILVLALLLSQADPTFAAVRDFVVRAFTDLSVVPRGLFFGVLGMCLVGSFGIALRPAPLPVEATAGVTSARQLFTDTERLIVTGSIAVLLALFFALQVSYLFGNPGGRSGTGVSYADAVHRGFVELNVVSSVCAVVLFVLRRYAAPTEQSRLVRALEWVVVIQAQVLLASAFWRVNLYEAAYGFTRLRLYVQVYAVIASVALLCLLLELRGKPVLDRLMRRVLAVAVLAFGSLILVNSDAWIARKNLQRYDNTGQVDLAYLTGELGADAVPELVAALPRLTPAMASHAAACLRYRFDDRGGNGETHWFEWSLRRVALSHALAKMDVLIPATATRPCSCD